MAQSRLISIIVPVYNVERYLDRCVESLLSQTFFDFEIILVDDGATDLSGQMCDTWVTRDSRIRVIHKKNGGLSDARNAGIDLVKGGMIAFVDSDDCVHPQMFEVLYRLMEQHDADIVQCEYQRFSEALPAINKMDIHSSNISQCYGLEMFLGKGDVRNNGIVCNKLYRKYIFDTIRFPVGKIHEDAFRVHYIYAVAKRIVLFHQALYFYFQRSDSICGQDFSLRRLDSIEAAEDRISFFKKLNRLELVRRSMAGYYLILTDCYCKMRCFYPKETELIQAIRNKISSNWKHFFWNPCLKLKHKPILLGMLFWFDCVLVYKRRFL